MCQFFNLAAAIAVCLTWSSPSEAQKSLMINSAPTNHQVVQHTDADAAAVAVAVAPRSKAASQPTRVAGLTQGSAIAGCEEWITAGLGDSCWRISDAHCIEVNGFLRLNPQLGGDCANVWEGYSYCVRGPGGPGCGPTGLSVIPITTTGLSATAGACGRR
ncbi:hypothetical protein BX600DRAFT_506852 [Xylariales sp. PMI_506]|nr:hypothetical protein BX600DRAFT_506852 [Xylariales sp. PMI_506]